MKFDQLLDHFAKFGDIKEVAVRHETTNAFAVGIVTFKRAEDAKKALAGNNRVLNGVCSISVAVPNPILSCIAEYEIPFKSTKTLIDLDIDCLRSIFRFLPLVDLCAIADTCSRFRAIRMTTISSIHKVIDTNDFKDSTKIGRIVKKFGSEINSLEVGLPGITSNITTMDYCFFTLKSLTSLVLHKIKIDEQMVQGLSGLFVNLKSLKLLWCKYDKAISTSLLSGCRKLLTLELHAFLSEADLLANVFSGCRPVECLGLIFLGYALIEHNISNVVQFLKNQNNLRKLAISHLNQPILDVIVDSCSEHLKSLHLFQSHIDVLMVPKLHILFPKLEELGLIYSSLDASITDLFRNCKHMIKLGCNSVPNIHKTFNADDLPNLEHIKLFNYPAYVVSVEESVQTERFLKTKKKLKAIVSEPNSIETIYETIAGKNA